MREIKNITNKYFLMTSVAIVYFVAARLGLLLAYPGTNATPLWLPTGIALSTVLLLGNRMWPGIALGAFIANFQQLAGLGLSVPASVAASLGTSAGNTLEALTGAYLIHRFTGTRNPFGRSADVLAFILFGALISTTVSATIGTTTFCLSVSAWNNFAAIWLTWWLGDAAGAIVLVPLVMTFKRFNVAGWKFRPMSGNLLLWVFIAAVCYSIFSRSMPLSFLLFPVLIIAAFRLGQFGSAMAVGIISIVSTYVTVNGTGPFSAGTLTEALRLQQGFIGSIATASMVLAAIVSEQKKSELKVIESGKQSRMLIEALQDSERKYRELVMNANSIILRWNNEGKITFMNEYGLKFFGYSETEILGRHVIGTIVAETESSGRDLRPLMDQICADPASFEQNINENVRQNGERVWINWTNKVVLDERGQVMEILSIGSDITGHKQAEEELRKHREHLEQLVLARTADLQKSQLALTNMVEDLNLKKEELEAANIKLKELDRLKSMFVASMSHELRTPLNSIIGFTGIILQGMTGEINDEQKDQLQRVFKAGKHLLALITDVIDISKIEAGKIEAYAEEFPLDSVLNDALSELKLQIREKELEVEVAMIPEKIILKTDRKRLFQSVLNFLSNAVKYTENGKITVVAEEKGDKINLNVTDTGIGIKEEDLPMLFQSFVRLDSALKMTVSGTGLGLYLTKKLVTEVLGGEVSATSIYGKGSTFSLIVPKHLVNKTDVEHS